MLVSEAGQPVARILVCEDDDPTRALLIENLEADRFEVLGAAGAGEALERCRDFHPDLLLLDLKLPDVSGLDVLRCIRAESEAAARFNPRLPVIVVSGRGTGEDRVRGLSEGADDYLVKPFLYPELLARIRNLLARGGGSACSGPVRIGELTVDRATRTVKVGERPVALANKEYELLLALASDPARVFSKAELLHSVWGYEVAARTRTLDSHASRLRRKLDPERHSFVVNCWGVGYRLVQG